MIKDKTFFTTVISESYTITAPAGAAVEDARGRGFKFDSSGNFVLASAWDRVTEVFSRFDGTMVSRRTSWGICF